MFICVECGKSFDYGSINRRYEHRGEFWGVPCSEEVCGCPHCGGSFVEAKQCSVCDEWVKDDEWDVCEECREKSMTEEVCLEIGEENACDVRLNEFLSSAFSEEEIEQILLEKLRQDENKMREAIKSYCESDMLYFVEWVAEKWKTQR